MTNDQKVSEITEILEQWNGYQVNDHEAIDLIWEVVWMR